MTVSGTAPVGDQPFRRRTSAFHTGSGISNIPAPPPRISRTERSVSDDYDADMQGYAPASRGRGRGRGGRGRGNFRSTANSGISKPTSPPTMPAHAVDAAVASIASVKVTGHATARTSSTTRSAFTTVPFASLNLNPALMRAISEVMKYQTTTEVQAQSIPLALQGHDLVTKARTGTGKTVAFMLPALHRVLQTRAESHVQQGEKSRNVSILVVSPTRELATQIAEETKLLCSFVPELRMQTVFGGTNIRGDVNQFKQRGFPTVLVATPGRLLDHINTPESGLAAALGGLEILILDEADRLLDEGFGPDLTRIIARLPPAAKRQTLLFSATMPQDLEKMSRMAMRPTRQVVDCVGEEINTHDRVPQFVHVSPLEDQFAIVACVLAEAMREPAYKIIVFFTTARMTQLYSELFALMGRPVLEIHSRKSQSHRNKMSEQFRDGQNLIMFSSDVTARGLDFPDVSCVVQVGLPSDVEQYTHRIGRTGRAGKGGSGVLVLADFEAPSFLRKLKDLPIQRAVPPPKQMMIQFNASASAACRNLPETTKSACFGAQVGFYNGHLRTLGWDKEELVRVWCSWITEVVGESEVPLLSPKAVGMMGLKGLLKTGIVGGGGGGGGGRGGGSRGGGGGGGRGRNASRGGSGGAGRGRTGGGGGRGGSSHGGGGRGAGGGGSGGGGRW
jgi:ATP-dependent RNA helicase MSS116, mitochondrial